jgi:phosphohistidine phosphatase
MAEFIAKRMTSDKFALISSSAIRAFSTAEAFAKALGIDKDDVFYEEDLYMASENEALNIIKTAPDDFDTLFIFSHNPGVTYLVNRLSNSNIDNVPTCGVACITFDADSWKDIAFGKGELKLFEYPKKHHKEPLSD